ncbi:terminase small subunit protein [Ensifer adhaerens]|uniref:terminase small subunit-like protein n=1 Tax=Ensifer adhaerens TaxID=106592 RepID=UPI001CBD8865|nr:terminase small subunit protein [Ensifer adhaerens]MBZ7920545.1 terminase small subunit protein [Ensifer adhaerens]UAX93021.1 terminase small subunit protein [Ensifer adhaerens]UAY00657.1 terminase small subunit protein [Ensifer adhaerens]UAY08038.1 terminase small subunit protein [Ensifer adhaerens]
MATKTRKPRASQWGEPTREAILEKLSIGKSLREICSAKGMPSEGTVRGWAVQDVAFATQYARAREVGMEALGDEILQIADSQEGDIIKTEDGREIVNHDAIQRAKLRVDTRKWLMSKIAPKKYGDRLDLNHSGSIETMPDAAVESRLAFLLGKAGAASVAGGEGEAEPSKPTGDV